MYQASYQVLFSNNPSLLQILCIVGTLDVQVQVQVQGGAGCSQYGYLTLKMEAVNSRPLMSCTRSKQPGQISRYFHARVPKHLPVEDPVVKEESGLLQT